jgi:hypothetical protein
MGNNKPKSLARKFLDNCKATRPTTHWCTLPSELQAMFLCRRLAPYGRIFTAIWLRTVGKPRSLGVSEIETSQREIATASGSCASDAARLIAALHACEIIVYRKGSLVGNTGKKQPSRLKICPAMLEPNTLLDFFRAVEFILEAEGESDQLQANEFGEAVRMRMANPTEEPEPEEQIA